MIQERSESVSSVSGDATGSFRAVVYLAKAPAGAPRERMNVSPVSGCLRSPQSQALVTESTVEALSAAVLPRAAGVDGERRDADSTEPGSKLCGDELGTVVATGVFRHAPHREPLGRRVDGIAARDPAINLQREALPSELVDHREPLELAAALRAIEDEVPAADVVWRFGPAPMTAVDARAEASSFSASCVAL